MLVYVASLTLARGAWEMLIGWSYLWGMYLFIFAFSSFYSSFYLPSISKVAYQRLRIPTMHYRTTRRSELNDVTVTTYVIDQQSNTADIKYIKCIRTPHDLDNA